MKQTTKTAFSLGVDISKDKFDVCLWDNFEERSLAAASFHNSRKAARQLLTWIKRLGVDAADCHFGMEATGIYSRLLLEFLFEQGLRVSLINPARTKAYAKALGLRSKTDPVDAACIAQFLAAHRRKLVLWQPTAPEVEALLGLLRHREELLRERAAQSMRLETSSVTAVKASIRRSINFLQRELQKLAAAVEALLAHNDHLRQKVDLLREMPCVGPATALWLVALIESRQFQSAREVAAFVGVTPAHHKSGTSINHPPRISKAGDRLLRKVFYMPAVTAFCSKKHIGQWARRLHSNGKAKKAVVVAVMRKQIHIAFGILRHQTPYNPALAFPGINL